MNRCVLAVCAMSIALAGAPVMAAPSVEQGARHVAAQDYGAGMWRVADKDHGKGHGKGHGKKHDKHRDRDDRRHDRHDDRHDDRRHDQDRHLGWSRGDHVTRERYVVIERYRDYGYRAPPRGYQYVQVDGDILMIAIASGLIFEVLTNR